VCDAPPASPGGALPHNRSTRSALIVTLIFSAALSAVCIYQYSGSPFRGHPILDEASYVGWAERIAGGDVLGVKVFYQDPLYPYLLALLFSVFGKSLALVRVFQAAAGVASVYLAYRLGRALMSEGWAVLAAAMFALSPLLYFYELLILKSSAVIFLSAVSCLIGAEAAGRDRHWLFLGTGLSLGLLALLRGNFLGLVPFALVWAAAVPKKAPFAGRIKRSFLVLLGFLLVTGPVTARNYLVGGEAVLTTSQAGANFYIGNNEKADGLYVSLDFVRANPAYEARDFEAEAERRTGRELSPSEVSRFWFRQAFEWMRDNPRRALMLWLHKARLLVHNHEVPDNHSLSITRKHFAPALRVAFIGLGWIVGPAVIGAFALIRLERKSWFPAMYAGLYLASVIPFFVLSRYRVAALPAACVFAAASIQWAAGKWRSRDRGWLVLIALFLIFYIPLAFAPTRESRWPQAYVKRNIAVACLETGRPDEAIRWFERALEHIPPDAYLMEKLSRAYYQVNQQEIESILKKAGESRDPLKLAAWGRRLEELKQPGSALDLYEKALQVFPGWTGLEKRVQALRMMLKEREKAVPKAGSDPGPDTAAPRR